MKQERLIYLTIMSIESDILLELDFSGIISDFAIQTSRKVFYVVIVHLCYRASTIVFHEKKFN